VDWERRRRALAEVKRGEAVGAETAKLAVIARALALRVARPEVFSGAYQAIEAGPDVCRLRRGGDVEVVVPLSPSAAGLVEPAPGWRDLLPELPVGLCVKS
jgi:maltooligosyltrehalose synthase